MAKKVEPPKEEMAPAYFVQFSSLWCIMLGFFVMLLSLGSTQTGPGVEGIGEVRDAFGKGGGMGLMQFSRNVLFGKGDGNASSFRIRESAPPELTEVDSYIRGKLWQKGLANLSMLTVSASEDKLKVLLQIPVKLKSSSRLDPNTVVMLELLGEILLDLREYDFEVVAIDEGEGSHIERQRAAMRRAAMVARLLTDVSSLPENHVRAVGYSDSRYIEAYGMELVKGHILLSIEKSDLEK